MSAPTTALSPELAKAHAASVSRIQDAVRKFRSERRHFRVYHGSTSSTRPLNFTRDAIVDVSDMERLFPVDVASKTVKAEPNVPMDALVEHTLKSGLVPKIVMEFKGITVGGGYSGMSGESSMFKYGLFQNTVSEIEIVLGDGTIEQATREKNADLLEHAGGSLGTFGIVTLVTVELMDATKFVNLEVSMIDGAENVVPTFEAAVAAQPEPSYVDGIFFGPEKIIMMVGNMSNTANHTPLKKMEVHWFASHVEGLITKSKTKTVSLTLSLVDYLFRFDHGAFWGGNLAFDHYHVPLNSITKRLADPFLDSRTCYHALHKTGLASEYCVQDFGVPASNVAAFIKYVREVMPQCQLFLCPALSADGMQISSRLSPMVNAVRSERVYGVGVYGRGPRDIEKFTELNRKLETRASELLAAKLLYARTYYTESEFWEIYDKPAYEAVRRKYRAVVRDEPAVNEAEKPAVNGIINGVEQPVTNGVAAQPTTNGSAALPAEHNGTPATNGSAAIDSPYELTHGADGTIEARRKVGVNGTNGIAPTAADGKWFGLPDVYEKLHADMSARPKRSSVRGLASTLLAKARGDKNYLLPKK